MIEIELDRAGRGKIIVNGVDISKCVSDVTLESRAGKSAAVRLTVHSDVKFTSEDIRPELAAKLMHLGSIVREHAYASFLCTACRIAFDFTCAECPKFCPNCGRRNA